MPDGGLITGAALMGGASILGGALGADAARGAANTQAGAADRANALQGQMFNQTRNDLSPWRDQGQMSLMQLAQGLGQGPTAGDQPLNPNDVQKIYQRYMGRPVGQDEMASLMGTFKTPAELEQMVSQSGEYLQHANVQKNVAPVSSPLYQAGGQQQGGLASGSLLKPFGMEDFQESPAYQFNLEQGRKAIDKSASARGKYYNPSTLQDIGKFSQGLASNEFQNAYNNYNTNLGNIWNRLYSMSGGGQNAAAQTGAFGSNAASQMGQNTIGAGNAQAAGQIGSVNSLVGGATGAYNAYQTNQILQALQRPAVAPVSPSPVWSGGGGSAFSGFEQ